MQYQLGTEFAECVTLTAYLEQMKKQGKVVMFTHIPNSTFTKSWSQKRKNTAMGLNPGFPDYVILTPKEMIVLEMKRKKGGVVSKEQKEWLLQLWKLNIQAVVCQGFDEAKEYLEGRFKLLPNMS